MVGIIDESWDKWLEESQKKNPAQPVRTFKNSPKRGIQIVEPRTLQPLITTAPKTSRGYYNNFRHNAPYTYQHQEQHQQQRIFQNNRDDDQLNRFLQEKIPKKYSDLDGLFKNKKEFQDDLFRVKPVLNKNSYPKNNTVNPIFYKPPVITKRSYPKGEFQRFLNIEPTLKERVYPAKTSFENIFKASDKPKQITKKKTTSPPKTSVDKKCPEGKKYNPKTKRCVKIDCEVYEKYDKKLKKCVEKKCPKGKEINKKTGRCVKITCPPGKILNQKTGRCNKI